MDGRNRRLRPSNGLLKPGVSIMKFRISFAAVLAALFLALSTAYAEQYAIPLFLAPGTSGDPQGVLRLVNEAAVAATVEIHAIADDGTRSGPATVALGASVATEFDATELRFANAAKGLSGGLGSISGDVRLTIDSDAPIVPLAFVRASDGTLSAMHDTVRPALAAGAPYRYEIPVFNPSTEATQASRLRLINPGDAEAAVTIGGRDDGGAAASGGVVTLAVPAGGARTLTAQQLEAGGAGVTGRLGAGSGKWRLTVESDRPLRVVNIAVSAAGSWNNLSTTAAGTAPVDELGFAERFAGERVVFESRSFTATTEFFADGRFAETLEYFGFVWQAGGRYDYVSRGPDAGRVTTERDDDDDCGVDMYFGSPSGGRFATHCAGGGADDLWFGGRWFLGDGGAGTAYGVSDELPGVPTSGAFAPADAMGGTVTHTAAGTRIDLDAGGYFELADGTRYTCAAAGGCVIENGTVTRGAVTGRAGGGGDVDRFPSFRTAAGPGDRDYTVGAAIDALTLPEAAGGNPPLIYSLSPEVPGLSFDAATRRLAGTPTAAASYAMTYTVTDADGDTDSLRFTIEVRDAQSPLSAPEVEVSDTEIIVSFPISGSTGGAIAFLAAIRINGGSWRSTDCTDGTLDPGVSETTITWTTSFNTTPPAGTFVEARYRQYDGGSCSGSPGPWSPIGSFTVPDGGGGTNGGGVGTDRYCRDGDTIEPGNSCDIYNTNHVFEALSSGDVRVGGFNVSGAEINLDFGSWKVVARRNSDRSWTIEDVEPEPPNSGQGLAIGGDVGFVLEGL